MWWSRAWIAHDVHRYHLTVSLDGTLISPPFRGNRTLAECSLWNPNDTPLFPRISVEMNWSASLYVAVKYQPLYWHKRRDAQSWVLIFRCLYCLHACHDLWCSGQNKTILLFRFPLFNKCYMFRSICWAILSFIKYVSCWNVLIWILISANHYHHNTFSYY
jgi:hypothetical protein